MFNLNRSLRKIFYHGSSRGALRYTIRTWEDISDIDVAAGVCDAEFFKRELKPVPFDVKNLKGMLVVSPHQDDETLGCGGLMLLAAANGIPIRWLYGTDGALMVSDVQAIVETRKREAQAAADFVGAQIEYLGIDNLNLKINVEHLAKLADMINAHKNYTLFVPWLLDNPGKHRMINHLLYLADRVVGLGNREVVQYQVHNMLIANTYLDITSVIDKKEAMIRSYASQIAMFQPYDHINRGLNAWNVRYLRRAGESRYIELFSTMDLHEYLRLIGKFYQRDLKKTYRGQEDSLHAMEDLLRRLNF